MKRILLLLLTFSSIIAVAQNPNQNWNQFRGNNGSGVAAETSKPPIAFSEKSLAWSIDLPKGASSPIIWKDKLFITGFDETTKELHTMCIVHRNGKILWDNTFRPDSIEKVGQISSPAQSTLVTNGEKIIAYFGSCGFICYDIDGKLLWEHKIPCNKGTYGSATSPVIYQSKLIYLSDFGNPFAMAINLSDGTIAWKKQLNSFSIPTPGGQSVPCVYNDKIYIHRVGQLACLSAQDGELFWSYNILTSGISSPIIANGKVIAACWFNFSEENQRGQLPPFSELLKNYDKNQNQTISRNEIPDNMILFTRPEISDLAGTTGTVKSSFNVFDTKRDGEITLDEWNAGLELLNKTFYKPAGLIALNTEGSGILSDDKVLWRIINNISEVPTPLFYKNRIYMIKDGGFLTCVNPESGEILYTLRIGNPGPYIASPIAANDHIYFWGHNGKIKIIKAGDKYEIEGEYDFKDKILATPAIFENSIFIRTEKKLHAYSNK